MVVTQHSGDGKANQYFLRGYNLDHGTDFASYVDGVPVNMPTNAHGQGYSDLNFLIPELVDIISYSKGPYYARYGDFASAGVAEIRYVDALDHGFANLTGGTFNYERVLFASSCTLAAGDCGATGPVATPSPSGPRVLAAFEGLHEDGPWALPENLQKFNGLLRVSDGDRANGWSVDAIGYSAQWNSTDQVPLSQIQAGALCYFCALDPTDGGNSSRYVASGEWHRTSAEDYSRAQIFLEHYELQLWSNFSFYELRPLTGDQFEQEEHRNLMGANLAHGWKHYIFEIDSQTEVGVQLRHDNVDVGLFDTEARRAFATVSNEQVSETEAAVYAEERTQWSSWLRSVLALREDEIAMQAVSYSTPANSGSASASQPSPKLSLIFAPWSSTEFYVDAGRGFHSNDARGVIDRIDPTTGLPASSVPALVSSFGRELGVRTAIVPGLQSSLALWSLNSQSELVYNADSDIGSTSPNAASERYGVEWNNHYFNGSHLLLDMDLAWTHARFAQENENESSGDLIPNAVSKVSVWRATMENFGPWSAGMEARYIGRYPLSQDGSLTAGSSFVTNFRLQRRFSKHVSLWVDALNVANRKYLDIEYEQDFRVAPTLPVVPNGITVHPGEPREFRLTLSISD